MLVQMQYSVKFNQLKATCSYVDEEFINLLDIINPIDRGQVRGNYVS